MFQRLWGNLLLKSTKYERYDYVREPIEYIIASHRIGSVIFH